MLRSYSWSTNVAGRKHWRLLHPSHTPLLLDRFGREMAPAFDLADADPEAARRFPNLRLAAALAIEVKQVAPSPSSASLSPGQSRLPGGGPLTGCGAAGRL